MHFFIYTEVLMELRAINCCSLIGKKDKREKVASKMRDSI